MRRCYLHIGTHKTGTSTIQRALSLQPDRLAEAGFFFPCTGQLEPNSGQHGLASLTNPPSQTALVESLLDEVAPLKQHVILSSEEFTRMLWSNPLGLQYLIDQLATVAQKVVVVLYLRRQSGFIESNYPERLKSHFCLDFATYAHTRMQHELAEFTLDYVQLVSKLDGIHGIELVVRSYDALREFSVVDDFLDVIGWPAGIRLAEERINTAPALVESLKNFCRAQEQRTLTEVEERVIELIASGSASRPRMDRATRRAIAQHFDSSNRQVAARFGLPALIEEPPPERTFGEWSGLGSAPPPDHDAVPSATLDHLFSRDFVTILRPLSERFGATHAALAESRTQVKELHAEIAALRMRLERAEAALASRAGSFKAFGTRLRSLLRRVRKGSNAGY